MKEAKVDQRFDAVLKYIKGQNRIVRYAIILMVVFDALCFFQLMYGTGSSEYWAVPFGLVFGLITNIFAFLVGDIGLGEFYRIRTTSLTGNKENVVTEDVKNRRRNALIAFIVGAVMLTIIQGFLFGLKYNRINEINEKVEIAKQACINLKESIEHNSLPDDQKKEEEIECNKKVKYIYYSGVPYEVDFATMILPIFTSVISFLVGLIYGKSVDFYEGELARVYGNLVALEETLKAKREELNRGYKKELEELVREHENLLKTIRGNQTEVNCLLNSIETAGEISGLRNAIEKLISGEDNGDYGRLINNALAGKLREKFPLYYKLHLGNLKADLLDVCAVVHQELSKKAHSANDLKNHKIENNEYINKINEIVTPSDNLFTS